MSLFEKLFGKNKSKAPEVPSQPAKPPIPTETLMLSQLAALWVKERNPFYRDAYGKTLGSLGLSEKDASALLEFDCAVIRKFPKDYLCHPDFVKMWFFGLKQPFFLNYPREKKDIKAEYFLTVSELCKLIDEAEWHFWNSHHREGLSDGVWGEICAWRLGGAGAEFAMEYFEAISRKTGISMDALAKVSSHQGGHLNRYKWQ